MTPLLDEYFNLLDRYRTEFPNENVLLLMQVGSFYEGYEIDEPKRGCAKIISDVLRMHLTRKNGKVSANQNNPWMVGFPTYVLGKHLSKLNDEGYTVVIYDQDSEKKQTRILKGVYNYVMRLENEDESVIPGDLERKVFGIIIEKYKCPLTPKLKKTKFLITMVYVDMNSGDVCIFEEDCEDYVRGLTKIVHLHSPQDILLSLQGNFTDEEKLRCKTNLEEGNGTRVINQDVDFDSSFQIGLLEELYEMKNKSFDVIHELGLDRHPSVLNVLTLVLSYIKKHDPILASKLSRPRFLQGLSEYMDYNRDAFLELNISSICERRRSYISTKKQKSLFDIYSNGMSGVGKRFFNRLLRRPLYSLQEIKDRHALIGQLLDLSQDDFEIRIPDIEWLYLKWKRNKLSIRMVGHLLISLSEIYSLSRDKLPFYWDQELISRLDMFFQEVHDSWDLDKMSRDDMDFFRIETDEIISFKQDCAIWQDRVNEITEHHKDVFKIFFNSSDQMYYLQTTPKKWDAYQYSNANTKLYEIMKNKSTVRVSCEELDKASHILKNMEEQRHSAIMNSFRSLSNELIERNDSLLEKLIHRLAQLDCFLHLSRFFKRHHYHCPVITNDGKNHLSVKKLRHAIYEYIEKDCLFIPYDFNLHQDNEIGMLLYGMNSSGKSTLLKSIGIAVWLSQCGLYVPAEEFNHSLIPCLYSKIGIYDNLYCGHSTFVAEMSELNYMIHRCSKGSLILCDELTSGTETRSATGIVCSALLHFIQQEIFFIFTTHLHSVARIPQISANPKIQIRHFDVETDGRSNSLLIEDIRIRYNRMLKNGPGNDSYGIEIAQHLGLPEEFVRMAFHFREQIELIVHQRDEDEYKTSRYNKKLVLHECSKCGSKLNLHTHHITPQKMMKNSIHHKDGLFNLVVLCENCHVDTHHPS